jgi:hypothetical protein
MTLESKIDSLIQYVNGLKDFKYVNPDFSIPYNNMGATITDAILQAGTTWETVVKPRIQVLLRNSEARTTTTFYNQIVEVGIKILINWKDDEKPNRILNVTLFFLEEGIETESDLKLWLENEKNIVKFKVLRGIGNKTVDYFRILTGISTSAVDRHLIEFLNKAGIEIGLNEYFEAREIIIKSADKMGVDRLLLDHSIWSYMSKNKAKGMLC